MTESTSGSTEGQTGTGVAPARNDRTSLAVRPAGYTKARRSKELHLRMALPGDIDPNTRKPVEVGFRCRRPSLLELQAYDRAKAPVRGEKTPDEEHADRLELCSLLVLSVEGFADFPEVETARIQAAFVDYFDDEPEIVAKLQNMVWERVYPKELSPSGSE